MTVLVTVAAGVLGSGVARALTKRHHVRTTDLVDMASARESVRADLTNEQQARAVLEGMDVVHCAAVHPWKQYTDDQYLDCNVNVTHLVLKACVAAGVRHVVYTSSIAVVRSGPYTEMELPIQDDQRARPTAIYGLTKHMGEDLCRLFHRQHGLAVLGLRPVTFMPFDRFKAGLLPLTARWLPAHDIIWAHDPAADVEVSGVETAFLAPAVPYTPAEAVVSRTDFANDHYPGVSTFFRANGLEVQPILFLFSIDRPVSCSTGNHPPRSRIGTLRRGRTCREGA
jgi:nucleoside-diphosphate-sugar epimerase